MSLRFHRSHARLFTVLSIALALALVPFLVGAAPGDTKQKSAQPKASGDIKQRDDAAKKMIYDVQVLLEKYCVKVRKFHRPNDYPPSIGALYDEMGKEPSANPYAGCPGVDLTKYSKENLSLWHMGRQDFAPGNIAYRPILDNKGHRTGYFLGIFGTDPHAGQDLFIGDKVVWKNLYLSTDKHDGKPEGLLILVSAGRKGWTADNIVRSLRTRTK